jgi:hypothetical protein
MRVLWTLFKVAIGLAIAIPLGIVALVLALGVLATLLGLALLTLKLVFIGFVCYGMFRVAKHLFWPAPSAPPVRELPTPDPYYQAAMRELDTHIRGDSRS